MLRRNYRKTELPEDGINECRNVSQSQSVHDVTHTIQCCIQPVAVNSYFTPAPIQLPACMQEVMSRCRQVAEPLENVTGQRGSPERVGPEQTSLQPAVTVPTSLKTWSIGKHRHLMWRSRFESRSHNCQPDRGVCLSLTEVCVWAWPRCVSEPDRGVCLPV
jgi:hypothetical protein